MRSAPALLALAGLLAGAHPLAAQARDSVSVAARDLPRGAVLGEPDVRRVPRASVAGAVGRGAGVGWVTRRPVRAGEPLVAPAVEPPRLVQPGAPVVVLWRSGTLELRVRGEALNGAARGERVRVRVDARRRLEGVAVGPALVSLEPGRQR